MAEFFKALFDGTTTLDAYTPDVGAAPTSVAVNLLNSTSYLYNVGGVPALSAVDIADGLAKPKDPDLNGVTLALKLPSSPNADYYVEIEFDADPAASTVYVVLCLRASAMVVGAWTGARNIIGAELDLDGASNGDVYFDQASDGDATAIPVFGDAYAAGSRTWKLRATIVGNQLTTTLDDVVVDVRTISDSNFIAAGDTYVVIDFSAPATSGGHLSVPIRRIEAATFDGAVNFAGTHGGRYVLASIGSASSRVEGFNRSHSGEWTLDSRFGIRSTGTLPRGTLSSTLAATNVMSFAGRAPRGTLASTVTSPNVMSAALRFRGRTSISSRTGATTRGTLPRGTLSSTITTGSVIRAALTGRRGTLSSRMSIGSTIRAELIGPGLRAVHGIRFAGRSPKGRLASVMSQAVTLAYEGYSITLVPTELGIEARTTRLTACPFDHILRLGAKYFGIGPDGVYELTGDTYAGEAIVSAVETAPLGDPPNLKRPRSLFIGGRLSADFTVGVKVGESGEHSNGSAITAGTRNHRVMLGRGVKGRYLGFTFVNTDGADFQIDDITPEFDVLGRSVGGVE